MIPPEYDYDNETIILEDDVEHEITHETLIAWFCVFSYAISTILCVISLRIFRHYQKLWCLRNLIHFNFILCIVIHNMAWLTALFSSYFGAYKCVITFILFEVIKFCVTSIFCWMLVEGVYLYMSVMHCLHAYKVNYFACASIGWGIPLLLTGRKLATLGLQELEDILRCFYIDESLDTWSVYLIIGIIMINLVILFVIIYVLFAKFRKVEQKEWKTIRNLLRALLFLCPLLGINYLFTLYQPQHPEWLAQLIVYYTLAVNSTQGIFISICFCFYNDEVRSCISRSARQTYYSLSVRVHEIRRKSLDGSQMTFIGNA
ncbi:unnamed protein product [Bursaphelenchus okinawaensis]|uniref:G-protein coupled receptors family 2 profile 2 domain-containing protein n=1 Tax=Bursaphelenchus okinawaensis TaxID=465554 RepID=A0A811KA55_9BILA|nr:unnamed protein product [Bursaphelenchus okinawaensis]CAG9097000.1 unnamed protein product [Bursaphelenchus okinawaensis]